ncbi:hypothetical protein [Pantoea conspicua]|nr:hypothetical protein [Pantoea conspicua]
MRDYLLLNRYRKSMLSLSGIDETVNCAPCGRYGAEPEREGAGRA